MAAAVDRTATAGLGYVPTLDGLRTAAIAMVLLVHFVPEGHWFQRLPLAGWGVRLFFVLSGYLITALLFHARDAAAASRESVWRSMRNFYARRCLRIFPIYYATVAVICWLDVQHARESWPWLVTYTANILFALKNQFLWSVGHFWSLAVEEQFYLVWPWLVLLLPHARVKWAIVAAIVLAPVSQAFFRSMAGAGYLAANILPIGCTDSLGAGALLAWYLRSGGEGERSRLRLEAGGFFIAAPLLALLVAALAFRLVPWFLRPLESLLLSWAFAATLSRLLRRPESLAARILAWGPICYLGKISYGMYVYHVFMQLLGPWLLSRVGLTLPEGLAAHLTFYVVLTVAFSALSWHLFEAPLNRLKRHFPC